MTLRDLLRLAGRGEGRVPAGSLQHRGPGVGSAVREGAAMTRRSRIDEFELPAAIGNAVAAYYGPRRFAKFTTEQKRSITIACTDCAALILSALADDEKPQESPP